MKDYVCILPWRGLFIDINDDVSPCCILRSGFKYDKSIPEVMNNEQFKDIRKSIINGKVSDFCKACVQQKRDGHNDNFELANRSYTEDEINEIITKTNDDGSLDYEDIEIGFLDLMTSNTCNLTCRICSPYGSSSWGAISDQKIIVTDAQRNRIDDILDHIPEIRRIYFKGGEPFMMKEQRKIIERIIENGNPEKTKLNYITNGTLLDNEYSRYLKSVWPLFDRVNVTFSIDGSGQMAEYTRQGLKWDEFLKNYRELDTSNNVSKRLKPTLSNINIWHYPDMIKEFLNLGLLSKDGQLKAEYINCTIVNSTEPLHLTSIPYDVKLKIKERFEQFKEWMQQNTSWPNDEIDDLLNVSNRMFETDTYNRDEVRAKINHMDQLFGTSFYDVQPEYAKMLLG